MKATHFVLYVINKMVDDYLETTKNPSIDWLNDIYSVFSQIKTYFNL